jgi:hypothetical protein
MSGLGVYSTSYFSEPSKTLDPALFDARRLKPWARQGIMGLLDHLFGYEFRHHEIWSHPWLAGSGVSYQWQASRHPADLDCLVGVDFVQFRKANPEYAGLMDGEIADMINELFRSALQPKTENWHGFELTFYVNKHSTDIREINPYAAYDLKYDEWTVPPDPTQAAPNKPEWEVAVDADTKLVHQINMRFTTALNDYKLSQSDALRRNAEVRLFTAKTQAEAMFEEIHGNRRQAFTLDGAGYYDFNNYRWQAGKRSGAVKVLRDIKDHPMGHNVELPDTNTLIRRAATYRNSM